MTVPMIAKYSLGRVVARLTSFAQEAGIAARNETYIASGKQLLGRRHLEANSAAMLRVPAQVPRPIEVDLPLQADRIFVQNKSSASLRSGSQPPSYSWPDLGRIPPSCAKCAHAGFYRWQWKGNLLAFRAS